MGIQSRVESRVREPPCLAVSVVSWMRSRGGDPGVVGRLMGEASIIPQVMTDPTSEER
jgi:hypothetical protein